MIRGAQTLKLIFETGLHAQEGIAAASLTFSMIVVVHLEQILRHGRNQGSRQEIRGEHSEDDGFRERNEEEARHSGEEEHRNEHDADAERGNESRDSDLRSAGKNGVFNVLVAGFEIAINVLDFNGRVVDEDSDCERESAERHDVDGLAQRAHDDDRRQNGKRN